MMHNAVIDEMLRRRSVRSFKGNQIKPEELETVLEAGKWAASGKGAQSPRFVAIQNKADRDELSSLNAAVMGKDIDPFYGAPTVVAVFSDPSRMTYVEDGALAIGNMMLAASSIGLGSCWIHRAREEFCTEQGKALMKKWGIPENYVGIGHCILGYPDCPHAEGKPRKADYSVIDR